MTNKRRWEDDHRGRPQPYPYSSFVIRHSSLSGASVSSLTLLPPRQYRWNYTVMGLDISLFVLALSFASVYGILPLFVRHLSAENLAVGAIPAIRAGTLLPPIFVAGLTERLRRKQPFIVGVTLFERV